jgi:hypothetical protein
MTDAEEASIDTMIERCRAHSTSVADVAASGPDVIEYSGT